jgi:glutaredoxin
MKIDIYSKDNCSFCERAKTFLNARRISYDEFKLGKDVTLEEIRENFPLQKTFPIILVNNEIIGGYTDLVESFSNPNFGLKLIKG